MQNEIIAIVGRKGSGKSTALRRIMEPLPCIVLWDPLGEHCWCPNPIQTAERLREFFRWARGQERFGARFIAHSNLPMAFDGFADLVYRRGNLVVGVEEVPMISEPNWLPDGFDRLVRLGRHRGIDLVWTAQRMSEVARRLTSATDRFLLFRHTEPRDIDAIQARCGIDVADRVARLGQHEMLEWDVLSQQIIVGANPGHGKSESTAQMAPTMPDPAPANEPRARRKGWEICCEPGCTERTAGRWVWCKRHAIMRGVSPQDRDLRVTPENA